MRSPDCPTACTWLRGSTVPRGRLIETRDNRAVAAYVDIDRFKDINDTLGHHTGDQLIKLVSRRLTECLRPSDFLARFRGDEFVILCAPAGPKRAGPGGARRRGLLVAVRHQWQNIRVTASVGIAVAPYNGTTADDLMRHADIALYEAKGRGRNCAVPFSEEMARQVERRRAIELDLRTAIETGMLCLNYQPLVSSYSEDCRPGGFTALAHPVYGDMSPADFIPIAENAGLLPSLGEWVISRAMEDSKRWPHPEISVNLSRCSSATSISPKPCTSLLRNTMSIRAASSLR